MNLSDVIEFASNNLTYLHCISPNDTGRTGGHQSGFLIARSCWPIWCEQMPARDGTNPKRDVLIEWDGGDGECTTESLFTYYNRSTRNEFRLTRFGRDFPYLDPEHTGDLLVLSKSSTYGETWSYKGWVLAGNDMADFLEAFGLTPLEANNTLLDRNQEVNSSVLDRLRGRHLLERMLEAITTFPSTERMALMAQQLVNALPRRDTAPLSLDDQLTLWIEHEFAVFRAVERRLYEPTVMAGFPDMAAFLQLAMTILQRRKARAGKSLELHAAALFVQENIQYTAQGETEQRKRPDFIFPSIEVYHDTNVPIEKLTFLAVKTTCKDRWRQILNEADRFRDETHYLLTLQKGISHSQMEEMRVEGVQLVVPKGIIADFPREDRHRLLTVSDFIRIVREKQDSLGYSG